MKIKFLFIISTIIFLSCDKEDNVNTVPQTWHSFDYNDIRLSDISIINNIGYIYGTLLDTVNSRYLSRIYKTTNSGDSWTEVEIDHEIISIGGYHMFFVNENLGFLTGYYELLKTTDGGINWDTVNGFNSNISFSKIEKVNSSTIIGYFGRGNAYISYDLGNNWNDYSDIMEVNPNEIDFINEKIGYAISNSTLYKTVNGGQSWSNVADFHDGCTDLDFYDENFGVAITMEDNGPHSSITYLIHLTSNGGLTWASQSMGAIELVSILYEKRDKLYVGSSVGILLSTDNGVSWKTDYESNSQVWSIDKISNKIIGVEYYKFLLKY